MVTSSRPRRARLILSGLLATAMPTALVPHAVAFAEEPTIDPEALVRSAVDQARQLSYYAHRVDWAALQTRMISATRGARDAVDMIAAYDLLVEALDDGHSFVNISADDRTAYRARTGAAAVAGGARIASDFIGRSAVERRLVGRLNLVVVPAFSGGGERGSHYAAQLRAAVLDGSAACGHIVDLRGNTGGNQWPMIAGLSPLLGDGDQGREVRAGGKWHSYARVSGGSVRVIEGPEAGAVLAAAPEGRAPVALQRVPVAVLIDGGTASSGAGVAIAFRGRDNTRFFGQRTHPTTSSNEGFVLADGTNIVVTSAMMADRRWTTYPGGMEPDEAVPAEKGRDTPLAAAMAWLSRTAGCRRS
jgi:carboxyl-terminal processing protease